MKLAVWDGADGRAVRRAARGSDREGRPDGPPRISDDGVVAVDGSVARIMRGG